jgi:hypothetical protein
MALSEEQQSSIVEHLKKHFYTLSLQKFSSNVIDKCIFKLNRPSIKTLIDWLFMPNEISAVQLANLILNEYANFVVKNLFNRNK